LSGTVRLGLVGAGRWGRVFIRTIGECDGVVLAGLASDNPDSSVLVPEGCRLTKDWRALISDGDVDGLIVAVPPAAQCAIATAAIEAGVPVLLEKPLSLDVVEAERLLNLADSRDALVMVDHTHLYHPAYMALKSKLADLGGPGAVTSISAAAGNWGPFRGQVSVLWDWGAHDIAMILDVLNETPGAVSARQTESRAQDDGLGESYEIELEFAKARAAVSVSNLLDAKLRRLAVSAAAELVYDGAAEENFAARDRPDAPWKRETIGGPLPITRIVTEFAASIAAGARDRSGLRLGAAVVSVLERCQKALDGGAVPPI
jgi:predicted dehydrogenase